MTIFIFGSLFIVWLIVMILAAITMYQDNKRSNDADL